MRSAVTSLAKRVLYGRNRDRVRATWRILPALVVGFLALTVSGGVATALGASPGTAMLASFGGTTVATVGILAVSSRILDRRPVREYGYRLSRAWWSDLVVGVATGVGVVATAFFVARATGSLRVTGTISPAGLAEIASLGLFFAGFVGVAFYEEFLYRGLFVTNAVEGLVARGVSQSTATGVALVASTAAFALVHLPSAVVQGADLLLVSAKTGLLGGLLGVAYVLTDELAFPTGLHLGVNFALLNVFGVGAGGVAGIPSVLAVEVTATGAWSPVHGLPIVLATLLGYGPVFAWGYWRDESAESPRSTARGRPVPEE